jgi:hypothetical protein
VWCMCSDTPIVESAVSSIEVQRERSVLVHRIKTRLQRLHEVCTTDENLKGCLPDNNANEITEQDLETIKRLCSQVLLRDHNAQNNKNNNNTLTST